jgi:hypothetical protein
MSSVTERVPPESGFRVLEGKFSEIEERFESEPRQGNPDQAGRRRELEEGIAISLPFLKGFGFTLKEVVAAIASGATLNIGQLHALRNICRKFSAFHDQASDRLLDLEQAGCRVNQASEFKARLREIHGILDPIGRVLEEAKFPLPVSPPPLDLPSDRPKSVVATPESKALGAIDPALLEDVEGLVDDAEAWFHTPNPVFEGRKPIELIGTLEEARLRNRIEMAKHGMFS